MGWWRTLRRDIKVVFERDPAAKNIVEVILAYPGLHAIWLHRIAHWFYERRWFTTARLVSHLNRWLTSIEIHPGAVIGDGLFIDHGLGVVIGETAELGDDVTLYQGVTLGGTGKEKAKRHPTLGDEVVVGVGAKVLGSITVGDGSKVGAGAVVVDPVPENCTVVGIPGRVVKRDGQPVSQTGHVDLEHGQLPDPLEEIISDLAIRLQQAEDRLALLENRRPLDNPGQSTGGECTR